MRRASPRLCLAHIREESGLPTCECCGSSLRTQRPSFCSRKQDLRFAKVASLLFEEAPPLSQRGRREARGNVGGQGRGPKFCKAKFWERFGAPAPKCCLLVGGWRDRR